jgi:hypothetical protein
MGHLRGNYCCLLSSLSFSHLCTITFIPMFEIKKLRLLILIVTEKPRPGAYPLLDAQGKMLEHSWKQFVKSKVS